MPQQSARTTALAAGGRILLIEDDADITDLVAEVLQAVGCTVVTASAMTAAETLLQKQRFTLVLVDGLSHLAATALANAATILRLAAPTPVVLFTAHPVEREAARRAGFAGYLIKPFDLDELVAVVTRTMGT